MTGRLLEPFALSEVRLLDGVVSRPRDAMLGLARAYPVDRLLAVFRRGAGLDDRGARPPGGWEDLGHPEEDAWGEHDYPGPERARTANLLRGHYAGHFLSMLAMAGAGEHDAGLQAKTDELVAGLTEVQAALAATGRYSHPGLLSASGEWQFARLEAFAPYGEIWAPYYTCHKIMAGLLDAHELAGSPGALETAVGMARWVHARLSRLDPAHRQRMWSLYIAGEFGGMNETLARLAVVADEPALLGTARMFDQDLLLDAAATGRDVLTGLHANQHLPQLAGWIREYEATGDRSRLDAAATLWGQVVPGRTMAHGGTGEHELWGPPDTIAGGIGTRNAETCATYNLVKIARLLLLHTRDPRYLDFIERASLNQILGSRRAAPSAVSPEVTYMFPVHPGALPEYDNTGTCCGGTGLENHVGQQASVFLRSPAPAAELWVGLYVPASLEWAERGLRATLSGTVPGGDRAVLRIDRLDGGTGPVDLTVRLRLPTWLDGPVRATVGGRAVELEEDLPGWALVRHRWSAGDELQLRLPMALKAVAALDDPHLRHLQRGPAVLAARDDRTTALELPLDGRRAPGGALVADEAGAVLVAGVRFEPVWAGSDERYHLYVRERDDEVAFAGRASGVPNRRGGDGGTLLERVWRTPEPATRDVLLDRVLAVCVEAVAEGLLTRGEAEQVLAAAARVDDGPDAGRSVEVVEGPSPSWSEAEDGATVWTLPPAPPRTAPPRVSLAAEPRPSPSGWHLEPPVVRVEVLETAPGSAPALVEASVDGGGWSAVEGALTVAGQGVHVVEARATRPDGARGTARLRLAVDTAAPRTTATLRRLGDAVEVVLAAEDDASGVDRIRWRTAGAFWATFQEAFTRPAADEEQVLEVAAVDRAGNEEPVQRIVLPARTGHRTTGPVQHDGGRGRA